MTKPSPRWAFLDGYDITKNGHAYLSRLRIISAPWFGIYLHHIHAPDKDRDPHDHPWWFASLILSGSYTETIHTWPRGLDQRLRSCTGLGDSRPVTATRRRWTLHAMPRDHAHKITAVTGSLWTLVLTGPRHPTWRFWTPDGPADWKDYEYAGDDGSGDP